MQVRKHEALKRDGEGEQREDAYYMKSMGGVCMLIQCWWWENLYETDEECEKGERSSNDIMLWVKRLNINAVYFSHFHPSPQTEADLLSIYLLVLL